MSGVLHDAMVHCKKKTVVNGKATWAALQYVRVVSHKLPGGKTLKVKAGKQHIDRGRFLGGTGPQSTRDGKQIDPSPNSIRSA